ncbi:MAG: amidohydrolase [Acidimicrobiia bacterium]|nr:amidohydrolase [Acidimicrobiia bacterium]
MREYRIVDADCHVMEPPDLWKRWLPERFQDRAPRLVKDAEGGDAWELEPGRPPMTIGLVTTPGKRYEDFKWTGSTYESIRPSCFDGKARLEDMDADGVDAELLYPSQRTMHYFMGNQDVELHRAGVRAYNDFLAEEFCAADPERLFGLAQIPNLGVDEAVAELRRCREKGYRGAIISAWPSGERHPLRGRRSLLGRGRGDGDARLDPHQHPAPAPAGEPARRRGGHRDDGLRRHARLPPILAELIMSGLFDRRPGLTVVGTEVEVGWIPEALEQLDNFYWRNRTWTGLKLADLPSEYFHRHFVCTFIKDRIGVVLRHDVGVENMAWSSDFPHHGNDWPYSRAVISEMLQGVPKAERDLIVGGNAARIYGLGTG